jgi:hypothetical protein
MKSETTKKLRNTDIVFSLLQEELKTNKKQKENKLKGRTIK